MDTGSLVALFVWLLVILFGIFALFGSIFTVEQQTVRFVERFGKFKKIGKAGLNFKVPFIDNVSDSFDLRLKQSVVEVETKTKDNVFVKLQVAIQYEVVQEKAYDAFYRLQEPGKQIGSYVFDVIRAQVPKLTLDETFEKKDDIAIAVKEQLEAVMAQFGYSIEKALVTDITPDEKVKEAMNEINAAVRLREAANSKAEAEKVIKVKNAEAEAESKKLQGEGIAAERKAIIAGLRESVESTSEALGIKPEEVMNLVLMTQYFDTLREIGKNGASSILLPHSPAGMQGIREEIMGAMLAVRK